jgi:hypothetical protein
VHGKEHQDSPPNESLMAATSKSALLMIWSSQRRILVQKGKRKRAESEREVDVFKKGQTCLIYGNAIDQTSRAVRLRRRASQRPATSLHGKISLPTRQSSDIRGWAAIVLCMRPCTCNLGSASYYVTSPAIYSIESDLTLTALGPLICLYKASGCLCQ